MPKAGRARAWVHLLAALGVQLAAPSPYVANVRVCTQESQEEACSTLNLAWESADDIFQTAKEFAEEYRLHSFFGCKGDTGCVAASLASEMHQLTPSQRDAEDYTATSADPATEVAGTSGGAAFTSQTSTSAARASTAAPHLRVLWPQEGSTVRPPNDMVRIALDDMEPEPEPGRYSVQVEVDGELWSSIPLGGPAPEPSRFGKDIPHISVGVPPGEHALRAWVRDGRCGQGEGPPAVRFSLENDVYEEHPMDVRESAWREGLAATEPLQTDWADLPRGWGDSLGRCLQATSLCKQAPGPCRGILPADGGRASPCRGRLLITGVRYSGTQFMADAIDASGMMMMMTATGDSAAAAATAATATPAERVPANEGGIGAAATTGASGAAAAAAERVSANEGGSGAGNGVGGRGEERGLRRVRCAHERYWEEHDVLVSWSARCDKWALLGLTELDLRRGVKGDARTGNPGPCLYDKVFLQVRHPLRVLSSIRARSLKYHMQATIDHATAYSYPSPPMDFSDWGGGHEEQLRALEKSMLHWVTWNLMAEQVADYTYQVEATTNLTEICLRAEFDPQSCVDVGHVRLRDTMVNAHGGRSRPLAAAGGALPEGGRPEPPSVTWEMMEEANARLAGRVWQLARRYGYDRDPPLPL